ncbi:MAG: hypothetical protein LBQ09_05580 [Acidobacteriaceae bacterium]|jgi:hypothetical protein|nr:hypothetical protein [Acidobacteriaceae bacterium]
MWCGVAVLTLAVLAVTPAPAFAEWQLKPFAGVTFGGATDLVGDLDQAVPSVHPVAGANLAWLGNIFGAEGDVGYSFGFFEPHGNTANALVLNSHLTTFTGNVIVAMPRRLTEYTLRPYLVAGGGLMRASTNTKSQIFELANTFGAMDIGGGVTGFVSKNFGYTWDIRYFTNVNSAVDPGLSLVGTSGKLKFWRATMAMTFRN